MMQQNKTLLEKYNHPVPRYTSYPPANFFTDSFTSVDFEKVLPESNNWLPENISVYIHIPFCKKMCFYCGCNMCPMGDELKVTSYIEALKAEIKMVSAKVNQTRQLTMVHFGGGTPNAIPSKFLTEIVELLKSSLNFSEKAEIAIECNPAYLDFTYIDQLLDSGFNRFSLGIQDFDTNVLKTVNRDPSALPVKKIMDALRKKEGTKVNLDFIYGLPGQSANSFKQTIQQAIELKPDRLVTFSYAHVPWVNKAQQVLEKKGLPDSNEKIAMYTTAQKQLTASGYIEVGMDHYVLENDELNSALQNGSLHRNFQGYCTRETTGQVYAFGTSAITQLQNIYAQNTKSVDDYINQISQGHFPIIKGYQLSENQVVIREAITELMCNKKLNWNELSNHLNSTEAETIQAIPFDLKMMNQFQDDGILTLDAQNNITITENGLLFIRNVAASLDPLMADKTKTFSKPV